MLSKALKAPRDYKDYSPRSKTSCSSLRIASSLPHASSPVGSFSEETMFEYTEPQLPATRLPTTPGSEDVRVAQADDASAWFTDTFEDDKQSEDQQRPCSGFQDVLAVSRTSERIPAEQPGEATRSHQSPGWAPAMHISAPTISQTLQATVHQAESRRNSLKTALSAVTMGILAEDADYTPPPLNDFTSLNTQPFCSSLPHNLSRCRSMPRPIAPHDGSSLTSASSGKGDPGDGQRSLASKPHGRAMRGSSPGGSSKFCPPHELAAASFSESPSFAIHPSSSRHKSIAERLRSVVFEQTGQEPFSCGRGFLA